MNFNQRCYTTYYSKYTIRAHDYCKKPYDIYNMDPNNCLIQLLSKLVKDNHYFFIKKSTGLCELVYTDGINDIKIQKYDMEHNKHTKYFFSL